MTGCGRGCFDGHAGGPGAGEGQRLHEGELEEGIFLGGGGQELEWGLTSPRLMALCLAKSPPE